MCLSSTISVCFFLPVLATCTRALPGSAMVYHMSSSLRFDLSYYAYLRVVYHDPTEKRSLHFPGNPFKVSVSVYLYPHDAINVLAPTN